MCPAYSSTLHGGESAKAPQQMDKARGQTFQVHSSSHNPSGPVTPVPGEIQLSTSVSIDYSSLLIKDESIIETPRDPNWNLNFGRLPNEMSVPNIF